MISGLTSELRRLRVAGVIALLSAALAAPCLLPATASPAPTEYLLHDFMGGADDGSFPGGTPLFSGPNTLYQTTTQGGKYHDGAVVRLVRAGRAWREELIYSFTGHADGFYPTAGLIADRAGALYGTASNGGTGFAAGTVFKLTPSGGVWKETTLHTFRRNGNDGSLPSAPLIADAAGNLYGTTRFGGGATQCIGFVFGCGSIFELKPIPRSNAYTEIILHRFTGGNDGAFPVAGLLEDKTGALYGTTVEGGYTQGVAFKLVPPKTTGGPWSEHALHYFTGGADGGQPMGTLVADSLGNLYGTASAGGKRGQFATGTVFRLAPETGSADRYTFTTLHEFAGEPSDGSAPTAGVVLGPGGVIFGCTQDGGTGYDGTVFELLPPAKAGGNFDSHVLHDFSSRTGDTIFPLGGIVRDADGDLFGTGNTGTGRTLFGAIYEIVP